MPLPGQEIYPIQLLAQKLNNRAAHCIEIGDYETAVSSLVRALRIAEVSTSAASADDDDFAMEVEAPPTCSCRYCSLDYCMTYSQQVASQSEKSSMDELLYCEASTKVDAGNVGGGYVYRQPIRVSPQTMNEGHSMGVVLPLILTFNLALTHHLSSLSSGQKAERSKLQRVLRLYELAYRWQIEEEDHQVESIRFTMVIANNLGEIHRAVSNHDKHQKCLQHLLSTLMFIVDCNSQDNNNGSGTAIDMDGFLRNTSELILHSRCAGAA